MKFLNIGKIFKAASVTFKQYRSKLLTFAFTWAVLIGAAYILFNLLLGTGAAILASVILFLPLQVSLSIIAIKAVNRREVLMNDFYTGFKSFYSSFFLESKILLRGVLFFLLGLAAGLLFGSIVLSTIMLNLEPQIFQNVLSGADVESMIAEMGKISWLPTAYVLLSGFSYLVGAVFFIWQGSDKLFAPFVCFETRFSVTNAVELSNKFLKQNRGSYFAFNLVFLLMLIPICVASYGLSIVLGKLGLDATFATSISLFVLFLLSGIVLIYHHIANYHAYHHYYRDHVIKLYQDFVAKNNAINNPTFNASSSQNAVSHPPFDSEDNSAATTEEGKEESSKDDLPE